MSRQWDNAGRDKTYQYDQNGKLVQFIFNQDREVIAEQDSLEITRYIRSSELIARNTDAARTYYHYVSDEMGSTTHIVDEDGIVLNHYDYDAWGNLTAQEEAVPNRFKFTGQQLDPVTQPIQVVTFAPKELKTLCYMRQFLLQISSNQRRLFPMIHILHLSKGDFRVISTRMPRITGTTNRLVDLYPLQIAY